MVKREQFVQVWNESASVQEASEKLNLSKNSLSVRASMLRKQGVELKYFRQRKTVNVGETNVESTNV